MPGTVNGPSVVSRILWLVLVASLLGVFIDTQAVAQTFTAGVRGAVLEATGGVIPGVTVQLINEGTNASREVVSNETGEYSFSAMPPGTYTVRAAFPGFKTYERRSVRVATQQFITLDIQLEVGDIQETVTVTGEPPLIETSNASVGTVLDGQQLNSLPSVARNAYMMSVTVPTVVSSGNQVFTRLQDLNHPSLVSLGGGARRANNYLIDGVPHTDLVNRPSVNPSFEAVDSVNVQLHTYDAETVVPEAEPTTSRPGPAATSIVAGLFIKRAPARSWQTTSSPSAPARRRPTATSITAAARLAAQSFRTERFSGTRSKAISRWTRAAARSASRRFESAPATSLRASTRPGSSS